MKKLLTRAKNWLIKKLGGTTPDELAAFKTQCESFSMKYTRPLKGYRDANYTLYCPFDEDKILISKSDVTITKGGSIEHAAIAPWCERVVIESPVYGAYVG